MYIVYKNVGQRNLPHIYNIANINSEMVSCWNIYVELKVNSCDSKDISL